MHFIRVNTFDDWRPAARQLISADIHPEEVSWNSTANQPSLFEDERPDPTSETIAFSVPKDFLELAKQVACHRDHKRWALLYRILWRLTHNEPHLLKIITDGDVHRLDQMQKAVSRDVHKMKAFVRFRKVASENGDESYIAWHRPDHRIVRLAAPFFSRRFRAMNWSILTPQESVSWDQTRLIYGDGVPASEAPNGDALEELWKTYYASIFNPARIKVAAMKREMPVRHWPTLPETTLIPEMMAQATARVEKMVETQEGFATTATDFFPTEKSIPSLARAAEECQACGLHQSATQIVFGRGPTTARIMFVGEQPGDREDIEGKPFVGEAGKLLDSAMKQAGITRREVYITNTVKHFKFTETMTVRGKHRLHKKPDSREIFACRPWLEAELEVIQPKIVVCLGATSAQALFGRNFRIKQQRGIVLPTEWCRQTIATWHPAAILRMPEETRRAEMTEQLVEDLAIAGRHK